MIGLLDDAHHLVEINQLQIISEFVRFHVKAIWNVESTAYCVRCVLFILFLFIPASICIKWNVA